MKRQEAIDIYNRNPNVCQVCGKTILVRKSEKPSDTRKKKFCSKSCAAKFNNSKFPKRGNNRVTRAPSLCKKCGAKILDSNKYYKRKFCLSCRPTKAKEHLSKRGFLLQHPDVTKGQIKEYYKNCHESSSRIRTHAAGVFKESGRPYICNQCGYSKHVEVCHIKAITDFDDNASIKEINSLDNLVALCPNCHWEFDHLK